MKYLIFLIIIFSISTKAADSLFASVQNGSLNYSVETQNQSGTERGENIFIINNESSDTNYLPVLNGSLRWSEETQSRDGRVRGKNVYIMNPGGSSSPQFWDTTNHIFHNVVPTNDSTIQVLIQGNAVTLQSVGGITGFLQTITDTTMSIFIGDVNSIFSEATGVSINARLHQIGINSANGIVAIGDIYQNGGSTTLVVDDGESVVRVTSSNFYLGGNDYSFSVGDINGVQNNTMIVVSDVSKNVYLQQGADAIGVNENSGIYIQLGSHIYSISVDENGFLKGTVNQ